MKAKDLRNSILMLTIQGKLVEQNPHDEPASILLGKIWAEKAGLIKQKKIKKEKPLPEITEAEKPFDLPEGWEWVRLGEIVSFLGGNAYKSNKYVDESENLLIRLGNIKNNKIIFKSKQVFISDKIAKETASFQISNNMVLVTMTGTKGKQDYFYSAYIDNVEKYPYKLFLNQRVGALIPYKGINGEWLNFVLKTDIILRQVFQNETGTANQGNIGAEFIKKILIPLPANVEQQRIVAKLDELMPQIYEYEQAETTLTSFEQEFPDKMRSSILQAAVQGKLVAQNPQDEPASVLLEKIRAEKAELIKQKKIKKEKPLPEITEEEKPFDLPVGWEWVRLGDICTLGAGTTPLRSNAKYYGGNIPWLKTRDLNDGVINTIPETITEIALEETSLRLNKVGTVLIAMYGATIGKLGILGIESTTNQACCGCNLFNGIYNKYLFFYLMSQRNDLRSKGEGGAQPNISKEKLQKYPFPLPPLAEQYRIVSKIDEMISLCNCLKKF